MNDAIRIFALGDLEPELFSPLLYVWNREKYCKCHLHIVTSWELF